MKIEAKSIAIGPTNRVSKTNSNFLRTPCHFTHKISYIFVSNDYPKCSLINYSLSFLNLTKLLMTPIFKSTIKH